MVQLDIFGNPINPDLGIKPSIRLNIIRNGEYTYQPSFFNLALSDRFFQDFRKNILWRQESMNMYGKKVSFPRLTSWYGDNDKPYTFSGITLSPSPWTQSLVEIKNMIQEFSKAQFNSVLLNLYRHGNDSISWHTDAEPELGKNPIIASVTFGASRTFQLRHKHTKEQIELELTHGSLLIMQGELQHYWQHQIPKTKKIIGERINLTFRNIKT